MNTDKIYAEAIANEYSIKKTSKVIALKKLDHKAKMPANIAAFTLGCISSLMFGLGMCISMNIIGNGNFLSIIIGIIIGMFGIRINYFLYKKLLENGKQKYASDIIRLASEISENK